MLLMEAVVIFQACQAQSSMELLDCEYVESSSELRLVEMAERKTDQSGGVKQISSPGYARSGSAGSESRRSLTGVLGVLIQSPDSFKFITTSQKSSSIGVYEQESSSPQQQQQQHSEADDDEEEAELCSPQAVFDGPGGGSSSESTTSNVTPYHNSSSSSLSYIFPFPASFPAPTTTSLESPAYYIKSFSSLSLSNAVPESPGLDAISPLSFDTRGHFPGRYQHVDLYASGPLLDDYGSGTDWNHDVPNKRPPFRSKSSGYASRPLISFDSLFHSKSLSKFQKFNAPLSNSDSNFQTSRTSSSGFSIDLSGRLSSGLNMTSSRYLELDFREAWRAASFRESDCYMPSTGPASNEHARRNNDKLYDIKADIKNRVEEVVRKTDESKFTFSPVASSFLFAKSQSHEQSMKIFSGRVDADYIEIQPDPVDGRTCQKMRGRKREKRFPRIFCCFKS